MTKARGEATNPSCWRVMTRASQTANTATIARSRNVGLNPMLSADGAKRQEHRHGDQRIQADLDAGENHSSREEADNCRKTRWRANRWR